jgi:eukaryotic-like serine/threonine-protein kinase
MQETPAPDWRQLSALYDEAQTLTAPAREAWLARLLAEGHPQWPLLQRMLLTPEAVLSGDFLYALPPLGLAPGADGRDTAATAQAGMRVGPYRLLRPLGEGGMAEVWLAERDDGAFERRVALKLLHAQPGLARQQSFRRRFEREHRILAALRHPHIAALHDAGVTPDGLHWLALEVVDGVPIDTWCDTQRLGIAARVRLFGQVLQAVAHAHGRLVLHRDLKPSNVLVTPAGDVRLLDFGIATLLEPDGGTADATELTQQAGRPLTPRYASPEQLEGAALGVTSDVWSLGVMLYELLCGVSPHRPAGPGVRAMERAILDADPLAPSRQAPAPAALVARGATAGSLRRALSPDLDAIVLRALARDGTGRYASVDALAADLDRWLAGEPVSARRPGPAARAWKFARRHPWGSGLGSAAVLVLGVTAGVAAVNAQQAREEAARARAASQFVLRLFEDADPDRHAGRALAPAELLARGRDQLARGGTPAALQADLLEGIAHAQMEIGENDAADTTLAQWEALLPGPADGARRAWVQALRAENAMRVQQFDAALDWLARSEAQQPDRDAAAAMRAKRGEVRGWVANYQDRLDEAAAAFDGALAAAQSDPRVSLAQHADLHLAVAQNEAERGRPATARAALAAAAAAGEAASSPRTGWRHHLALTRAAVRDRLADYDTSARVLPQDLALCDAELGSGSELCQKERNLLWRAWLRQGRVAELRAAWPAVLQIADGPWSEGSRFGALQIAHRAAWQLADPALQVQAARRLDTMAQTASAPSLRARARLAQAEAALYQGDPQAALARVDEADALLASNPGQDRFAAAQALLTRGHAVWAQGDAGTALAAMQDAQRGFEQALGARHPLTLWLGLNRIAPARALGRDADAAAWLADAQAPLEGSLGADSPAWARMQALRQPPAAPRAPRFEPFD